MSNNKQTIINISGLILVVIVIWFLRELYKENEIKNMKARAFDIITEDATVKPADALMQAEFEFMELEYGRQVLYEQ
jgi:uncharacterized protein YpmB